MEKFAIVILNYNTYDDTVVCVDSIKKFTSSKCYKIFLVDNASPDKSGKNLLAKYNQDEIISVIQSDANLGFSGGNNIGIRAAMNAGFEYVYLLNSDIILQNDAFAFMQKALTSNENVAVVGPTIFNREGHYAQFARRALTLPMYLASRRAVVTIFPQLKDKLRFYRFLHDKDYVFDGMVYGCCFGMKADFIQRNKCLDDNVFMYYEEDIIAYLLKKEKRKSMIAFQAVVVHNEAVSTKRSSADRMLFTRFYRWTSALYVMKRYAKVNSFICWFFALQNILNWKILALRNRSYKEKLQDFIQENKKALG